ncbi:MAG: signal peptidase I [Firmicutes bacterium]|nr:signal peptidase I [Bacillota bacterium]
MLVLKRSLKVLNVAVMTLLVIVFVSTLYLTFSSRVNNGNPSVAGQTMYEVLSGSMEPTFNTGSVIFDNPDVNISALHKGDIITFHIPRNSGFNGMTNVIVTHRIERVFHEHGQVMFQTKGDANPSVDPWVVAPHDIIAQYDNFTIPYMGYYLSFIHGRWGDGLLLIIPGAFLVLSSIVTLVREVLSLQNKVGIGGQQVTAGETDSHQM